MRRDLEQEGRADVGIGAGGTGRAPLGPGPGRGAGPPVERDDLGDEVIARIQNMEDEIQTLRDRYGLPVPIGDQTIGGLKNQFQKALEQLPGFAGMHRQDLKDITEILGHIEKQFGSGTGIYQLKEAGYTPLSSVMRQVSDLLQYVGQASDTNRTVGTYAKVKSITEAFFRMVTQVFPGVPVKDVPGLGSRMSLGHAGLEELFSMLTEQETVGKLGMKEFRFKDDEEKLEGIIDFFARFRHESGLTGARAIEIATGKGDEAKIDQVVRYIESTMRYVQREAGDTGTQRAFLKKLAKDPEKYAGLVRVTTAFTTAIQDFEQKMYERLVKGPAGEVWEDVLDTVLEVDVLEVPQEMQMQSTLKDITGMRPEEQSRHRAINMIDWLTGNPEIFQKFVRAVNPLTETIEQFSERLRGKVDAYKEELIASGRPVTLEQVTAGVVEVAGEASREAGGAARHEIRGALRVLGRYKERGVSGRPYKIGRGLKTAYGGWGQEIFEDIDPDLIAAAMAGDVTAVAAVEEATTMAISSDPEDPLTEQLIQLRDVLTGEVEPTEELPLDEGLMQLRAVLMGERPAVGAEREPVRAFPTEPNFFCNRCNQFFQERSDDGACPYCGSVYIQTLAFTTGGAAGRVSTISAVSMERAQMGIRARAESRQYAREARDRAMEGGERGLHVDTENERRMEASIKEKRELAAFMRATIRDIKPTMETTPEGIVQLRRAVAGLGELEDSISREEIILGAIRVSGISPEPIAEEIEIDEEVIAEATGGIGFEVDWREYLRGMKTYSDALTEQFKDYGVGMSVQKYLEWGALKLAGQMPEKMRKDIVPMIGFLKERMETIPDVEDKEKFRKNVEKTAPLVYEILTGAETADIKDKITTEMIPELNRLRANTPDWDMFINKEGVTPTVYHMEMFMQINTKMSPATRVSTMRWS